MESPVEPFIMELNGVTMHVEEKKLPGQRGFQVVFSSKRRTIVVVRATNRDGERFWTTVPEDITRQKEAEGVGKLIEEHFKKLQS
jgi:hypothetical protein